MEQEEEDKVKEKSGIDSKALDAKEEGVRLSFEITWFQYTNSLIATRIDRRCKDSLHSFGPKANPRRREMLLHWKACQEESSLGKILLKRM